MDGYKEATGYGNYERGSNYIDIKSINNMSDNFIYKIQLLRKYIEIVRI